MRDDDFVARLLEYLDMPGEGDPYPHDANPHPADPRDASFDVLCTLYLEADEAKRAQIAALFAREAEQSTRAYSRIAHWVAARQRARDDLSNLILYMRRLSSSMGSGDATWRLRLELWQRRRSCRSARTTATSWSRWPFCTTPRGGRGSTLTPSSGRWLLWRGPRRRGSCAAFWSGTKQRSRRWSKPSRDGPVEGNAKKPPRTWATRWTWSSSGTLPAEKSPPPRLCLGRSSSPGATRLHPRLWLHRRRCTTRPIGARGLSNR
jgi:hypothetical protein